MQDQSPRPFVREVSALGRIVRTGPVYPTLVVYHCIFRTTAALIAGQGFLMLCVWLAAGGNPNSTGFGRLLGAVGALLTAPAVLYLLSALVRYRGPAVVADRHGLRLLPDFLGPSEVQPWNEVANCYSSDVFDRFGAVRFRWTQLRTPLGRPLADEYRLDHRLLTTLLPVSADGLAAELDALREHYRTEPTPDERERRNWDAPHEGRWPYLDPGELPPRPDPATGVPLPARAPLNHGDPPPAWAQTAPAPAPPAGQSPALAWHDGQRRGSPTFTTVFVIGFLFWPFFLFDWDELREHPLFWGSMFGGLYWFVWITRTRSCAAGADWLGYGNGWVRTYQLTTISQRRWFGDRWLRLEDSAGRRLSVKVADLQENPIVWDLFYNGVLHSAIVGDLRANHKIHRSLRLPYRAPGSSAAEINRGDDVRAENVWAYSPVGRDPGTPEPVDGDGPPREDSASTPAGDDQTDKPTRDVPRPPAPWMARKPTKPDHRLHRGPTVPTSSTRVVGPVDRNRIYRDRNDLVIDMYPDD